jgi:integrase
LEYLPLPVIPARVNAKIVSERLGHHSVALTLDTYAHVLPDDYEHAAALFQRHVYGGGA